ncbi:MAG: thiamine pyrophosphate-dependent enzyme [Candidatus Margulisiibacteriota bacterium]
MMRANPLALRGKVPYSKSLPLKLVRQIAAGRSSFSSGTGSCPGCAGMLAVRLASRTMNYVAERLGAKVQIEAQTVHTQQTGCIEVVVSSGDLSASRESFLHPSFSDGPSVMRGIEAAYDSRVGRGEDLPLTLFWNFSGDGGTYNIGMRAFSALLQNGRGLLLVYDNRGFMNTGAQWSSSSFPGEKRMTAQVGPAAVGAEELPKDLIEIAVAHDVPYVASASLGSFQLVRDFMRKIAIGTMAGREVPAVVLVDAPCPREQKFGSIASILGKELSPEQREAASNQLATLEVGKWAVETGAFRVLEVVNGKWIINAQRKKDRGDFIPIDSFLASQGNLRHLLRPENRMIVDKIQAYVNRKWGDVEALEAVTAEIQLEDVTIPLEKVL